MRLDFLIQGSSYDPYSVCFEKTDNRVTVTCTCGAGIYGKICKHKTSLMSGSSDGLVSGNPQDVETARQWVQESALATAMAEVETAERELAHYKKLVSKAKERLADEMRP